MPRVRGERKASPDAIIRLCRERGDWHGTSGAIPSPGHGAEDRGTTIRLDDAAPLGFLVNCFNGDPRDAWRYVCSLLGIDLGGARVAVTSAPLRREPTQEERDEAAKKRAYMERIVRESREIHGTIADDYLQSRGLKPPFPKDLRFHPELWTRDREGKRLVCPGMVALVRRAPGAEVQAIHRTFLGRGGAKSPKAAAVKAMLGPVKGGAVWPDEFGTILAIGEGIESCLSFTQLYRIPCAAALSATNLGAPRLPGTITEIAIAADNDANLVGQKAAIAAAERMKRPWRSIRALWPKASGDFNDMLARGE